MYITLFNKDRIFKVDTSGIISTFVGTGVNDDTGDGQATSARVGAIRNCCELNSSGNVYISDVTNDAIRVVTVSTKIITKYAGVYTSGGSDRPGDGGPATSAAMKPQSIFLDSSGNMFVGDYGGYRVRKIAAGTKIITNFAGNPWKWW
jgi:hypothetical protein